MQVGKRHLSGWDQIEVPLPNLEEIVFELRQVARTFERRGIDEERRENFRSRALEFEDPA